MGHGCRIGCRISGAGAVAALLCAGPAAAEPAALRGGLYEVEVRLELPHLEDRAPTKVVRVCLSAEAGAGHHGLAVLSDNNPLARCPTLNGYEGGGQIAFDIACGERNAARAKAGYTLVPDGFRGRITMQMGGKNMTMTEVQVGRRVGACEPGQEAGQESGKDPGRESGKGPGKPPAL